MWTVAAIALLVLFAAVFVLAIRRNEAQSLALAQAAGSLAVLLILVLGVWFHQSSLFFIALAAIVLSFPSALVMARLLRRELDE